MSKATETIRKRDFISRLSDQYGESVRERMIAIPESVHERMKEIAMRIKMPVYEAYTEAARLWLKSKGVAGEVKGVGSISVEEERIIGEILELYRARKVNKVYQETINAVKLLLRSALPRE